MDGFVSELAEERAFEVVVRACRSREIEHGLKFGVFLFADHVGGGRRVEIELLALSGAVGVRSTVTERNGRHGMAVPGEQRGIGGDFIGRRHSQVAILPQQVESQPGADTERCRHGWKRVHAAEIRAR